MYEKKIRIQQENLYKINFPATQLYCTLSAYVTTKTISRQNQKTDTTAQLYCTLSMYETSKTISRQNQKTNTTSQLYCTLST